MSSPVRRELEQYVAGRGSPERLVIAASVGYYRDGGRGMRTALQSLIDVIDRASPGIVELGSVATGTGFEVRLAERPFPREYEESLRTAAAAALAALGTEPVIPAPGFLRRVVALVQRVFSA